VPEDQDGPVPVRGTSPTGSTGRPGPAGSPGQAEVTLGVVAVARRLGVATGTLRTWDRRYGLGPGEHPTGTRRRYTARDLARLGVMRRLMLEGVAAAEAARVALAADVDELLAADPMGAGRLPAPPDPGRRRVRGGRTAAARAGGGRVVPLREAGPAARGLARAAVSLDADACTSMVLTSVRRRGVVATWVELLLPVLAGVGERWRSTGAGVEVEHLLSECIEAALRVGVRARPARPGVRPVLLAALEPEDHRLPLVALSAALAEAGLSARLLGPRLPARALADAVARTGACGVFLWSQGARGPAALPDHEQWAVRPRPVLLLGGPGWAEADRWRAGASWVADLPEALEAVRVVTMTSPAER
jgi:DNA-binding transcriptional MerR regulator